MEGTREPSERSDQSPPVFADRDETPAQRADRNMSELLQELRVAQTGVQLLFGFLLAASLSYRAIEDDSAQRTLYVVTLVVSSSALGCLMAPVTLHRLAFRRRIKAEVAQASHQLTIVGMALLTVSLGLAVALAIWVLLGPGWAAAVSMPLTMSLGLLWFVWPVRFRARLSATEREDSPSRQ